METLWQDVRYGLRMLRKAPGFSALAVATIALGIGANTAMFSILDAVLLRPPPYREPQRLVYVRDIQPQLRDLPASYPEYLDWKEASDLFAGSAAYNPGRLPLTGGAEPIYVSVAAVSASLFDLLDIRPLRGRLLEPSDDSESAERVALLGYGLWQSRFGGASDVLGRRIEIDGRPTTVVGILPPAAQAQLPSELRTGRTTDVWLPLRLTPESSPRGTHFLTVVARLQPGTTIEQAQRRIELLAGSLKQDGRTEHGILLVPVAERLVSRSRPIVALLMAAVGFVLLIACANVANLALARVSARRREMAVRAALGARPQRLMRQLLVESLLLAAAGGTLGVLLAAGSLRVFSASAGADLLRAGEARLDAGVLAFCLGLVLLTGVLFGLAPALQARRVELNETLQQGGRQAASGAGTHGYRRALVVAELGLSLVLLVGAGLLLRSFGNLTGQQLGFDPERLLTFRISLPEVRYDSGERVSRFYDDARQGVASLPGVEGASLVSSLPIEGGSNGDFNVEGMAWPAGHSPLAEIRVVEPGYFGLMRIPLLRGRLLQDTDTPEAQRVMVVDQTFAREVFGSGDPLGRRVYQGDGGSDDPRFEIVGVVGDVQHWSLGSERRPAMYFSHRQQSARGQSMLVRAKGDPSSLVDSVRRRILEIDKDLPIARVRTMQQVIGEDLAQRRLALGLLVSFAVLALLLAALGVYGVVSNAVAQRTQEMGVRMAFGAERRDILVLVVTQALRLCLAGVAAGLPAALAVTRLMRSQLFEVSASDPATLLAVPLLLTGVALLASYWPARQAARLEPLVALRYD
jgi:putative ABC transport system permease protein